MGRGGTDAAHSEDRARLSRLTGAGNFASSARRILRGGLFYLCARRRGHPLIELPGKGHGERKKSFSRHQQTGQEASP